MFGWHISFGAGQDALPHTEVSHYSGNKTCWHQSLDNSHYIYQKNDGIFFPQEKQKGQGCGVENMCVETFVLV